MNCQIRKALYDDVDSLARVFVAAFAGEPWYEAWQFETAKERIFEVLSSPKSLCFVYQENDVIMGCTLSVLISWHTGFQLEGKELFVDPQHQKRGIAEKLMRHVETVASDLGVTEAFFWTMREQGSSRLLNFYRKLGFDIAEERAVMVKSVAAYSKGGENKQV